MRLFDTIQQAAGTVMDRAYYGLIGHFARYLHQAECFELSPQVVAACGDVCSSKPSSILAATPILKLPYEYTWLEWYGERVDYIKENNKIVPDRMGCLLIAEGGDSNRGYAYWAWYHHEHNLTIAPFGIAFDWDLTHPPVMQQLIDINHLPQRLMTAFENRVGDQHAAAAVLVNSKKWYDKANSEKEVQAFIELEKRATIVPVHFAAKFIRELGLDNPKNPWMANFTDDVCGELPFVEAFLIMLNSKHILERCVDDFTRLNKARKKARKPALKEFTTTKLRLTRTTENRMRAAGMDRADARMHLVRGHFKIRKSGVYWWSSFARGKTNTTVQRKEYKAE
jgi:hypothetical protein